MVLYSTDSAKMIEENRIELSGGKVQTDFQNFNFRDPANPNSVLFFKKLRKSD